MIYYTKKILISLLLLNLFSHNTTHAEGIINLDGGFTSLMELNLAAKIIRGKGTISAPNINITCDEFQFTGTIRCNGVCKIKTKKKFDYKMFKREGSGKFTIIITPPDFQEHTIESLLNVADRILFRDTTITVSKIVEHLHWIRAQAGENHLNKAEVQKNIEEKIQKVLSGQPIGLAPSFNKNIILTQALLCGGASAASLITAAILLLKFGINEDPKSGLGGLLAVLGAFIGLATFKRYSTFTDYTKQEEDALKVLLLPKATWLTMQAKLNEIFAQPYTPKTKIINL